jgi:SAM-dependent methyltransferase
VVVRSTEVVWHDLECGCYRADLSLWRDLADAAAIDGHSARVLDVGAGTGRVALTLARAGHRVTALDIDDGLLDALRERAGGTDVEIVCADARTFELPGDDFDLCLLPMQTLQLLGDSGERLAFFKRARAHLRSGGLLAVAIVTEVEPFDCADGDDGPAPETARVDGVRYLSRPTRVSILPESVLIERERLIYRDGGGRETDSHDDRRSPREAPAVRDVIELQRVNAPQLEAEAAAAGLHAEPARALGSTADHVGGTVVMLRV